MFTLPGVTSGPGRSYLQWKGQPGHRNLDALSICLRWMGYSMGRSNWIRVRFYPTVVSEPLASKDMILAGVTNGRGNGNKDEVGSTHSLSSSPTLVFV